MPYQDQFPAHLAAEVAALIAEMADGQLHPPSPGFKVRVQGEQLEIPYRVYYRQSQVLKCAARSGDQGCGQYPELETYPGTHVLNAFRRIACSRPPSI